MPRIRTIKPEFWVDEKVVELDPWARLLFIGLWNFADDQGFIDHSPKRIKMQIFPGDTTDVVPLLASLIEAELLDEYEAPTGKVLHVRGWAKHQKVSNPASPRFDAADLRPLGRTADADIEASRAVQSPPLGKERKGREEEGKGEERTDAREAREDSPPASTRPPIARFDELWAVYPLQDGQPAAVKAWADAIKRASPDVIIAGAVRYRDSPNRSAQYTKRLANWLRDDCWRDTHAAAVPPPRSSRTPGFEEHNGLMLGASNVANLERHQRMKALQAQRDAEAAINQPPAIEGRTR